MQEKKQTMSRIDGFEHPMCISGKKKMRQIIDVAARFAGMSIASYIRNCIGNQIIKDHKIDTSRVDDNKIKSKTGFPIPGSAADIIKQIMESTE